MGCEMISKVWKDGVIIEEEVELTVEPIVEEPIVFENRQELDDYIGSVVIQYLDLMTEEEEDGRPIN